MKKTSVSSNSLGAFLSPRAPNYYENNGIYNKGWCSERVPHPSNTGINGRRHISSASAFSTPFYSGRALPSKWEDAERWICSPVALYPSDVCKNSSVNTQLVEQRRPKSKSGPIVPPVPPLPLPPPSSSSAASECYQYYPKTVMRAAEAPMRGMKGSPFSTGVMEADRVFRASVYGGCDGLDNVWMNLVSERSSSSPSSSCSKEEEPEDMKEAEKTPSPVITRRDMATQMSPEKTPPSLTQSPRGREALPLNSIVSDLESQNCRQEVREVEIDKGAPMITTRPLKLKKKGFRESEDVYISSRAPSSSSSSSWDVSEKAITLSKLQREEAKIAAWENLQKAKAEAAIRQLEVKLEKKKSASIDKIMKKLQTAQLKGQEMRSSISRQEGSQISKRSVKMSHLVPRLSFINTFTSCFAGQLHSRPSSAV